MPHEELFRQLFGNSVEPTDRNFLAKVVADHPYFGAAHFFLLQATAPTDPEYRKIAARTALHFNNPYYLQFQLNRSSQPAVVQSFTNDLTAAEVDLKTNDEGNKDSKNFAEDVAIPATEGDGSSQNHALVSPVEPEPVAAEQPAVAKTPAAGESDLIFEPLHTTDYFASQGIKLSEEVQQGDKLGKQLRSFTDWLKTMKKVNQGKMPEGGVSIDPMVQTLADKSNKEEEVLTESMAEVYIQQGKYDKAAAVYNKLSLLNPSKTAYFAAKIEVIKNK